MTVRKQTDYFDDLQRLIESMKNFDSDEFETIEDEKGIQTFLKKYFGNDSYKPLFNHGNNKEQLLKMVVFNQSGGKSLKQDREQISSKVFADTEDGRENYKKTGSRRSDLKGTDTKGSSRTRHKPPVKLSRAKPTRTFTHYGRVKGKIVKARAITTKNKSKTTVRYFDSRGRFVKVNKK